MMLVSNTDSLEASFTSFNALLLHALQSLGLLLHLKALDRSNFKENEGEAIDHAGEETCPYLHLNNLLGEETCHDLHNHRRRRRGRETWTDHHRHGEVSDVGEMENDDCTHDHDRHNDPEETYEK
jgi:hypothetical protein